MTFTKGKNYEGLKSFLCKPWLIRSAHFIIPVGISSHLWYKKCMNKKEVLELIKSTASPLKRQLLMVSIVSALLEKRGKASPVLIGGCALSYYSREVYFTADIDLAYSDRESLNEVLLELGFKKEGRYWFNEDLAIAIEAPADQLIDEDAPLEIVEFEEGLSCRILGMEDLIIDRMNACKHWKSESDCEMVELLVNRYEESLDWNYLENKASRPENDILKELMEIRGNVR